MTTLKPFQYECNRCHQIISFDKRGKERGWCCRCEVASWTPEHKAAIDRVLGAAWRGETQKLPDLVKEAVKHL